MVGPNDRVFKHKQGSWIVVDEGGGLVKYGPDGKPRKTSATVDKLLGQGHGAWEEVDAGSGAGPADVGGAEPGGHTAGPPVEPAGGIADLVPAQAVVTAPPEPEVKSKPAPSSSPKRVPMAFEHADPNDVPKFAADPNYYFQQKVDGIRGQMVIEPGKAPWFRNRGGDALINASATSVSGPILAKLGSVLPKDGPSYVIDGELLDGKWYIFDMAVIGQEKMPWEQRMEIAEQWVKTLRAAGITNVEALPTARTQNEKLKLWEAIRTGGGEGVMMKRKDSPYNFGGRVNHTLKAKVRSTADVVVMAKGEKGKESATVGVHVGGKLQRVANVSLIGKEKDGPVNVGDVIEVAYLWANPSNNNLQQAAMEKKRPDKAPEEATDGQLRFVDKSVVDQATFGEGAGPVTASVEVLRRRVHR